MNTVRKGLIVRDRLSADDYYPSGELRVSPARSKNLLFVETAYFAEFCYFLIEPGTRHYFEVANLTNSSTGKDSKELLFVTGRFEYSPDPKFVVYK